MHVKDGKELRTALKDCEELIIVLKDVGDVGYKKELD